MISLSIDRVGLALPALVFTSDPSSGLWLPEDGMGRPPKRWRRQYADSASGNLHGSVLLRASLEQSAIRATLYVQEDTTVALEAQLEAVEAALGQFFYSVTMTVDGVSKTFNADPADVDWGDIDSGMARQFMASSPVSIPVYPIGA